MMGEVEEDEQKFVCKFCNKICLSGKSLGGHMRCHLPLIAASRNRVKVEADMINMDCENDDHDGDCGFEEKPNFTSKNREIWDQDQDSYILRENPKKSLRISDLRIESYNKDGVFCKECSKKFPSIRALAGHMRTHSTKGKRKAKHHICRECDKGFISVKGLFGHMKIHSKINRVSTESDGLSELEFCYPKKKRSVTKYRMSESNSVSSAKESASVIGIDQADADAAVCLVMLSNGVREQDVFNSLQESATNDAISSDSFDKGIAKIDEMEHNFCFLDKKTEFEYDCSDKLKMSQQELEDTSSVQYDENKISRQSHFTKGKKEESGKYEDSCSEMLKDAGKMKEYKCRICNMVFNCYQALGGHSNRHKTMCSSSTEINIRSDNQSSETPIEAGSFRMAMTDFEVIRSQEHECDICFKIFQTGQALGGHKRAHSNNTLPNEDRMKEIMVDNQDIIQANLDLSLPVSSQTRS